MRRTKGWRKPEGAVVVSRPSRWGNPYCIAQVGCTGGAVGFCWRVMDHDGDVLADHLDTDRRARDVAVDYFRGLLELEPWRVDEIRAALAGRDLACWCPLDGPCHADVLLEIANAS